MPVRAGRVPGGVPKFLAQRPLQPAILTTPAFCGTAEGENVARLERVVYDQTSAPVFVAPAVAAAQTLVAAATDVVCRVAIRSLAAFAATSAMAEPVFVPSVTAPSITSKMAAAHGATTVVLSRVVYDQTSTPVFVAPAATPSAALAYQPADVSWLRQRKDLPDGYIESFRPAAAATAIAAFDDIARIRKRITLPDGYAAPVVTVLPAPTPSAFPYQNVEAVWRVLKKDLPDGFAEPLRPTVAATPTPFGYQFVDAIWRVQKKDLPEGFIAPVSPPAAVVVAGITSTLAGAYGSPVVVTSRVVYDQTAAPVFKSIVAAATPTSAAPLANSCTVVRTTSVIRDQVSTPAFPPAPPVITGATTPSNAPPDAPQNAFPRPRVKPVPLSAYVFAYPVDDLAADYTDPVVRAIRPKPKVLPSGSAEPPFLPPPPPTPPVVTVAAAYSSPTVVLSRVVYDPQAARPVFPPAPPPAPPPPWIETYTSLKAAPINRDAVKADLDGYQSRFDVQPTITPSIWFETYPALKAAPINRDAVKADLDGFQPRLIPLPAVTPSYLFETIQPGWKGTPNAKAIGANLQGIVRPDRLPPPPAITPANLFDNVGPVQRFLANAKAVGINLQGAAWSPQDPKNLTGGPQLPPPAQAISPYPSGGESYYWQRIHKKAAKSDRRCRWLTIDGVLTWICDRLDYERQAETRLQALDLVYDAEGELEPLLEAVRLEEATNTSAAKRAAATLLMHAIHEAVIEDEDDDLLLLD